MKINSREYSYGKCHLSLPHVISESDDEAISAELMNVFFEKIKDEATSYAESTSEVRRYITDFTMESGEDTVSITVKLTARKISNSGGLFTARREIFTLWQGTTLKKFTFCDI